MKWNIIDKHLHIWMMMMMTRCWLTQPQPQQMYNMYITININSTTGILTANSVTEIHMIWGQI